MQLIALGGDLRMNGLLRAAERAGFSCRHVMDVETALDSLPERTDVVALPWPRSFPGGMLAQTSWSKERVLARLPACGILMGGEITPQDAPKASVIFHPSEDDTFMVDNANLTAEGAIAALLGGGMALMGKTCMVTGFGRIGRALTQRLCAMEAFVIVCARNEGQMQDAHRMGAHPVPMREIAAAAAQADMVLNTVPARVFSAETLSQMKPGVRMIELASAPYGADPEQAARSGVDMEIMGGVPGKYAPEAAGEAMFRALERFLRCHGKEKGDA